MKRYKLLKDLFDHKAGEIIPENLDLLAPLGKDNRERVEIVFIDLYTRLGVLEEVDENERWKPTYGEFYWLVCSDGEITGEKWNDSQYNEACYNFGNCFRTKEDAEAWREKVKGLMK